MLKMFEDRKLDRLLTHSLTIGSAVVDDKHIIRRYNRQFAQWFSVTDDVKRRALIGQDFYSVLKYPDVYDGRYAPFYSATHEEKGPAAIERRTILREVLSNPHESSRVPRTFEMLVTVTSIRSRAYFVVELRDVSKSRLFEGMSDTLRKAGTELTELIDREFPDCTDEELVAKLGDKIKEHMATTLNRDVCEIRLIDFSKPGRALTPFINFGMGKPSVQRPLVASATGGNGITGYVADTGESYVCKDTHNDPYYIEGAINARSSLTVPLTYCGETIGVFNVESRRPNDFSKHDKIFLQLYAKDVAQAIHMMESYRSKNVAERQLCASLMRERLDGALVATLEDGCAVRRELEELRRSNPSSPAITQLQVHFDSLLKKISDDKRLSSELYAKFMSVGELQAPPAPPLAESTYDVPRDLFVHRCIGAQESDYDRVVDFLRDARCLVVNKGMDDSERIGYWESFLMRYGARVDVFSTAMAAYEAASLVEYDFILANKYCDHRYFNDVTPTQAAEAQAQAVQPNDFDIHRPGYFEALDATALSDSSATLRRKILSMSESGLYDDAYFFYRRLAHRLLQDGRRLPFIILITPNVENRYDATHVQPDMSVLRRELLNARVVQSEVQFSPDVEYPFATFFFAIYKELKQTDRLDV